MKLYPRLGIDSLRFGDSIDKALALYGEVSERKSHPDKYCRTSLYFSEHDMMLGFNMDDGLTFIAVGGDCESHELWGGFPFDIAKHAKDQFTALSTWIQKSGRHTTPRQSCFGESIEVSEERVSFCFSAEEPWHLESVQLSQTANQPT